VGTYRDRPEQRPALWLPGVIHVETPDTSRARVTAPVTLGPAAGWLPPTSIVDWTRAVCLVERSSIVPHDARRFPIVLPEDAIDPARFPLVQRAARASPLVAFPRDQADPLREQGFRVYVVAWHRGSRSGYLAALGGGLPPSEFTGEIADLKIRRPLRVPEEDRPTLGRILMAISNDAVDERRVQLATELLDVLALPGEAKEAALVAWEAWLDVVFERAEPTAVAARELAARLGAASFDSTQRLPPYGTVRLERAPELVVSFTARSRPPGETLITLPPTSTLFVDDIEPWWPEPFAPRMAAPIHLGAEPSRTSNTGLRALFRPPDARVAVWTLVGLTLAVIAWAASK
jgi:hypothetical protein